MRENRTCGSEGGEGYGPSRPLSGRQLAEAVDIQQSYISQIETGKREGTIDVLRRIATVLEVTLDDLYPA